MKSKRKSLWEIINKNNRKEINKSRQKIKMHQNQSADEIFMHDQKSYLSYLWQMIKRSDRYKLYERAWRYFRPLRIALRVFRWIFILLTWIQASALLIVAAALLLLVMPVAAVLLLIFFLLVRIDATLKLKSDADVISQRKVVVLFRDRDFSEYFQSCVSQLCENYVVIVVCDMFALSCKNASAEEKHFFLNRLALDGGVLLVRGHYFFFLKRRALKHAQRVFFVY